jgi:mRNA interferase RelE/StbE
MTEYRLTFARSARHDLEDLDTTVVNRVFPKIEALVNQPRPSGYLKLRGWDDFWRIRVGDYRVIYSIDDARKLVDIIYVRHRSKAYSLF